MSEAGTLEYLVEQLQRRYKDDVIAEYAWYAIRGALDPKLLLSNLAEALRISSTETEQLLIDTGFGDLVAQTKLSEDSAKGNPNERADYRISSVNETLSPFPDLFSIEFSPALTQPIELSTAENEAIGLLVRTLVDWTGDPFLALYREDVLDYYDEFMAGDARLIDRYIADHFRTDYPRYLVNSGIGANEQFNHFVARINNTNPNRQMTWLIIDSPRHLKKLPRDADIDNTLFMEFSRSGKTEETVKIHEYTPRGAKRIVFANSGPLRDLGLRDANLVLKLPDQVSGRFGRNKTPILLAPMHVAKMSTARFWQKTAGAIKAFDLSSSESLPFQISMFLYLYQQKQGINHIYLSCNDGLLSCSRDELLQFWNEGVNRNGNDISMSGYFGLLRDSHATIEGILGNHRTKMSIFLLRDDTRPSLLPPMTSSEIDPINPEHEGLRYGDEEMILAEANYQRFSELMPTIRIATHGDLALDHAAILGQLWADLTFCYSRMKNLDPGSNPEVKFVRDRSAKLLAEWAKK